MLPDIQITVTPRPDDLAAVGRFAAARNADPAQHCGYVGVTPDVVTAQFTEIRGEHVYAVASTGPRTLGVLCAEWDPVAGRTLLYGPWAESPELMDRLYEAVRPDLPPSAARFELYCDAANTAVAAFAERHGIAEHGQQITMRFVRQRLRDVPHTALPSLSPPLYQQFTALHDATFPGTHTPAAELLAEGAPILAAADGARLLGYLVLRLRPQAADAQIRYVAVVPAARGRGIGTGLLAAGLHRALADRRFDAVELLTNSPAARRLYERIGFTTLRQLRLFRGPD